MTTVQFRAILVGEKPLSWNGCLLDCLCSSIAKRQSKEGTLAPITCSVPDSIRVCGSVGKVAGYRGEDPIVPILLEESSLVRGVKRLTAHQHLADFDQRHILPESRLHRCR